MNNNEEYTGAIDESNSMYSSSSKMFFKDRRLRIDFIIAFADQGLTDIRKKRVEFLCQLQTNGIEIEIEDTNGVVFNDLTSIPENNNGETYFAKLHATQDFMMKTAAILQFRKPVKRASGESMERLVLVKEFGCCKKFKTEGCDLPPLPYPYMAPFSLDRIDMFDSPHSDDFFLPIERSAAVDYQLKRTYTIRDTDSIQDNNLIKADLLTDDIADAIVEVSVDVLTTELKTLARQEDIKMIQEGKVDVGIDLHIKNNVFSSKFPLHEPIADIDDRNIGTMLQATWANVKQFYKHQPLNYIRLYFGESIALYFAWLGLYTYCLIPVGVIGLFVFCLSAWNLHTSPIVTDVCEKGNQFLMCPPCNVQNCKFWRLKDSCLSAKFTHFVDNPGTLAFALFMALWATLFMEKWKRYQSRLSYEWNVYNFEAVDDPPRPEFLALLKKKNFNTEMNIITKTREPIIPLWKFKIPVFITTYSVVFLGIVLAFAVLVGVITYRLVIKLVFLVSPNAVLNSYADILTTVTSSILNLIGIFILKKVYDKIAEWMTDLENHRTQSEYDSSITLKLYMLQFVNFYSSIFYIAFFQGNLASVPGDESYLQMPGCTGGNCLFQLFIQLAIIMVGKQSINMIIENVMPRLIYICKRISRKRHHAKVHPACSTDYCYGDECAEGRNKGGEVTAAGSEQLLTTNASLQHILRNNDLVDKGPRPLFEEYLEIIIQYGFITMFVPAFQLAPLFALANNVVELRTDADKFLMSFRRPVAIREKSIGIWFTIMEFISSIAIRTNACLIAFTSGFISRQIYLHHYSPTGTEAGFVNFTLSVMDVKRFNITNITGIQFCRYFDYRSEPTSDNPYQLTKVYWEILAAKFIFVVLFEVLTLGLTSVIAYLIPDVPSRLTVASRLENMVISQYLLNADKVHNQSLISKPENRGFELLNNFNEEIVRAPSDRSSKESLTSNIINV